MDRETSVGLVDLLSRQLLADVEESGLDHNIAQAAFGTSWARTCIILGATPEEFAEYAKEIVAHYTKVWEECKNGKKED